MSFAHTRLRIIAIFLLIIFSLAMVSKADNTQTVYNSFNCKEKRIALTFDDGPHPRLTFKILDVLKKHDIKATFFVIGANVDSYPTPLKRAVSEGHEIGIHTNSHCLLKSMKKDKIKDEISICKEKILNTASYQSTVIRPPCGMYDETLVEVAKESSFKVILWSIDTHDWAHASKSKIINTISNNVRSGDIILFHDYISGENHTVEALDYIIPTLKKEGYEFVTVTQLLQN